jgi:hypothetical protein
MTTRGDDFWAETEALRARQAQQRAYAAALLVEAKIIATNEHGRETFLMLHPSTVIPDGWQVSLFDRTGPFSHEEGATLDEAVGRVLERRDLSSVRPVTEQEFMAISTSPEFLEGVRRVTYTGLWNAITYEFGYELPRKYIDDAREAQSMDEAISILQIGLRTLRRQAKKKRGR